MPTPPRQPPRPPPRPPPPPPRSPGHRPAGSPKPVPSKAAASAKAAFAKAAGSPLFRRARNMLFRPRQEWSTISGEFTNAGTIYKSYVIPLSAVGPIATVLGALVFGKVGTMFGPVNASLGAALQGAVAHYVLGLASVYALAIALDVLAPSFGAPSNRVQALKLAAYASTPSWLLAVLLLVPQFGLLVLLGLVYTLWLLALGVPVVMKVPANAPEKATAYRLIAVIVALVLILILEAEGGGFSDQRRYPGNAARGRPPARPPGGGAGGGPRPPETASDATV